MSNPGNHEFSSAPALDPKTYSEHLWKVHTYCNEYVRFADTKAAAVVLYNSGLIGALYNSGLIRGISNNFGLSNLLAVLSGLLLFVSWGCAIFSIKPRLRSSGQVGFIFWRDIVRHRNAPDFERALTGLNDQSLLRSLSENVFTISSIC